MLEGQSTSRGLDNLDTVGTGVEAVAATESQTLNHICVESLYHQIYNQ